jgi:acyl carrier protein
MTSPTTTPTRTETARIVRDLLAQELKIEPSEIADADVLKDLPGADSLHLLRLVTHLERHWDTEFSDEEIFGATTFDDLVSLVMSHLDAGHDAA